MLSFRQVFFDKLIAGLEQGNIRTVVSGYLFLTILMFWDVLFLPGDVVLSGISADLARQFVHWRHFGFTEIAKGNLPFWNPHIYSGAPYFAGLQSALLYPPNWLYLFLPVARATNILIALHVFLGGFFFYLWTRKNDLHPLACFLAGCIFMFCAPHFLHIHAGHLTNLCTLVWAPLLLCSIDGLIEKPAPRWVFLGILVVSMMILAGHMQYFYYISLAAAAYLAARIPASSNRPQATLGFVFFFVGGVALTAVQLFPGFEAAEESVRGTGMPYDYAANFSFPFENIVTLLAPYLFGDMVHFEYWGRWYLWEMSLFMSVTGFLLAVYAIFPARDKRSILYLSLAVLFLLLAFGGYMPWFSFLYKYMPGFDKFRGTSKFILPSILFLIMLAALGLDRILKEGLRAKRAACSFLVGLGIVSLLSAACAHFSSVSATGTWASFMQGLHRTGETFVGAGIYYRPDMIHTAGTVAAISLLVLSVVCLILAGGAFIINNPRYLAFFLVGVALAELLSFAAVSRATFRMSEVCPDKIASFFADRAGDYRVLNTRFGNSAMYFGIHDIWGEDPFVSRRYAELMTATQNNSPDMATQYIRFVTHHPLLDMVRCRYGIIWKDNLFNIYELSTSTLPRLLLVHDWLILDTRESVLRFLLGKSFDPRKTIVLETDPGLPKGVKPLVDPSRVAVVDSSTDHLTIEADLQSPAVLLVTDTYSRGWQAAALEGSAQQAYRVMPANHALMGIPLGEGHHRFRLDYRPGSFTAGKWISICGLAIYIGALLRWRFRRAEVHEPSVAITIETPKPTKRKKKK